ncbi:MAG: hypothetical protein QOI59_6942 [Gammaproteobacteria bacterium]|jgi:putative SOS response-associated peptidase YedK|nr:hypothetical protein [Gammaproteobacteria bacterium]
MSPSCDQANPAGGEAGQKHPFGFAGLWDRSVRADGTAVESCAIITMPGNDLMRQVHNTGNNPHRMPAILAPAAHDAWLSGGAGEARAVLGPYPQDVMACVPGRYASQLTEK